MVADGREREVVMSCDDCQLFFFLSGMSVYTLVLLFFFILVSIVSINQLLLGVLICEHLFFIIDTIISDITNVSKCNNSLICSSPT